MPKFKRNLTPIVKKTPLFFYAIPQHHGHFKLTLGFDRLSIRHMSELDKKKAELSFWEKVFFALFATVLGVSGWFSSNYKDADVALLIATSLVFLFTVVFLIVVYRKIKRIIDEIGEL